MRKLFIVSTLVLSAIAVNAQENMGKISVCSQYAVTLLFETDIEFVIIGNNPVIDIIDDVPEYENYAVYQKDRTLIIKANRENIPATSINVKTADGVLWYGFLENGENTALFHDFTKKTTANTQPTGISSEPKKSENIREEAARKKTGSDYENKLDYMMKQAQEYRNFGIISGKLTFMVPNIMNDTENMYIKVIIQNESGNAFEINSVVFKHIEGKNRGVKKNQVQNEERVTPVYEKSVTMVEAYGKKELGYVLPLFSTGKDGRFIIQFVESRGTRNYRIELSSKDMQKIKVFK